MNYTETCGYLESLNGLGSVPGLDSIAELLKRLGNPQRKTRFVHIAGTNGKGSVGAFVMSVLTEAGYMAGRYLSPAVKEPLEIIQCSNRLILPEEYADLISLIRPVCEEMVRDGLPHPTRFEIETAAAFLFFERQKCPIAVVECGMGGLLDATNIISGTDCAVITSISLDHTAFLGNTLEAIAAHKAGIIKKGCEAVYLEGEDCVNRIIEKKAAETGCAAVPVSPGEIASRCFPEDGHIVFDYKNYPGVLINLMGTYQAENAALAIECLEALKRKGYNINRDAVYRGLAAARWFGRFERIGRRPDFIIDGAHNPAGARALAQSLRTYYPEGRLTLIIGIFADKDYDGVLKYLMPMAAKVFTVDLPDRRRSLPAKTLAEYIKKHYYVESIPLYSCRSAGEAVELALESTDDSGTIAAFGSLSHLALIEEEYRRRSKKN